MSLSLWDAEFFTDPFRTMRRMQRDMDNLFNAITKHPTSKESETTTWSPSCDVKETDSSFVIHAELPGVKKEDIHLELQDGVLTISGEKKQEKKEENEKWHRVERFYGSFQRKMKVPEGVTEENTKAKFNNGVLEVEFPKPVKSLPEKKFIPITGPTSGAH
jgi:HSP20 family protein